MISNSSPNNPNWIKYVVDNYSIHNHNGWCGFECDVNVLSGVGSYNADLSQQNFASIYGLTYPLKDADILAYNQMFTDWKAAIQAFTTYAYNQLNTNNLFKQYQPHQQDLIVQNYVDAFVNELSKNTDVDFTINTMLGLITNDWGTPINTNNPKLSTTLQTVNDIKTAAVASKKTVVNNSDGSITTTTYDTSGNTTINTVFPNGQSTSTTQQTTTPTSYTPLLLMGGAAILGLLILKKHK